MSTVYGIDPSLTGFAICAFRRDSDDPRSNRFTSQPHKNLAERIARYRGLINSCLAAITSFGPPKTIFLEGYSYGSFTGNILDLAELGGLLRHAILSKFPNALLVEVPPHLLKQFATGKGNVKKEFVMAHVAQRYGIVFNTNDECDAFVLAQMARCHEGWADAENMTQRKAIHTAINGKPKKEKKKKKNAV